MERFSDWTQVGVRFCRSQPRQEPLLVAESLAEFWANRIGASKIGSRSLTPIPSGSSFCGRGRQGQTRAGGAQGVHEWRQAGDGRH
jgi:hypothetical protein